MWVVCAVLVSTVAVFGPSPAASAEKPPAPAATASEGPTLAGTGVVGVVKDAVLATPIAGAWVAALRTTDFTIAGGGVADQSGTYGIDLAAGTYFLYLIDPAAAHTAGFFGPPTVVTVTSGPAAIVNPTMVPTRGSIGGTVNHQGSGNPINTAWAVAISGTSSSPEIGAPAPMAGHYQLSGLSVGSHYVVYMDASGAHRPEFYDDSAGINTANQVAVSGGVTATANAALAPATPPAGGAVLQGTVTEQDSAVGPLSGVLVVALDAANYGFAKATTTNANGQYSLDLNPGSYKLEFVDPSGRHNMEWYDNLPFTGIASAVSATAPGTANAALTPTTGGFSGTITDDPSGLAVAGAWVVAIGPSGAIAGGGVTDASGAYSVTGLAPGTYRATIVDPNGGRTQEYWDNSPDYDGSSSFNVVAGGSPTVDAAIGGPVPANDSFEGAYELTGRAGAIAGTNVNATVEAGEPILGLLTGGKSVWYQWTAPVSGDANFATCGTSFDTMLGVYTGSAVDALTTLGTADDTCGLQSRVSLAVTAGTTYRIAVDGYDDGSHPTPSGPFTLNWSYPPNDNFSQAQLLTGGRRGTMTGTNIDATREAGEPNAAGGSGAASIWYRWTADVSGTVTISTCGSAFDTVLAVYTGSSLGSLAPVAANDDACGLQSRVSTPVTAGTTYQVAVDGYLATSSGPVTINWSYPPNDLFSQPEVITGSSGSVAGTNVNGSKEVLEPNHGGNAGGASVWYSWTAPSTGTATFTTCGSDFDTTLGVYTGSVVDSLVALAGNDDSCLTQSSLSLPVTLGTTYRIAVDGHGGATGTIAFNWQL